MAILILAVGVASRLGETGGGASASAGLGCGGMNDPTTPGSQGTGAPTGIDPERVSRWFVDNIPGVALPLEFHRIAGGRSNLTFEVHDGAGTRFVLRRPPTSHVLPPPPPMSPRSRI